MNLPFNEYPPNSTSYRKLYLTQSKKLVENPAAGSSTVEYQSDSLKATPADFTYTFDETTHVVGLSKVKLWLSCSENDDMDVYISLRKVSRSGNVLEHINIPWSALPDHVSTQEDVPNSNTIKVSRLLPFYRLTRGGVLKKKLTRLPPSILAPRAC